MLTQSAGSGTLTPDLVLTLKVIYFFAGQSRWADIVACLRALVDEFNACKEFPIAVTLLIEEVDIARGAAHDLLKVPKQQRYLAQVSSSTFGVVIAAPPCETHTRAVFSGRPGPQPIRDVFHPRVVPNLSPGWRAKAEAANKLHDFTVEVFRAAAKAHALALMGFPEDLGATPRGVPASI